MSTIVDLVILGFLGFFQWYAQEMFGLPDLFIFFIKQLIMYLLLQLVLHMIPFLKRITSFLWFPFRFLHVYMHIFAAKEIARELEQKKDDEEELDDLYDRYTLRASFVTGLSRSDENSMLVTSFNRISYARQVALAPSKFGWIMLVGYLVISPLALVTPLGKIFSTIAGAIIHFYFFVGIFGVMMPTFNDWLFVLNNIILNLNIRPIFLYNAVIIHVIFTFDTFWRTEDFLIAIVTGTVMFVVYLWGLLIIALLALKGKLKLPKIFFVPFKSPKEIHMSTADIEFHHLEDEYEWDD